MDQKRQQIEAVYAKDAFIQGNTTFSGKIEAYGHHILIPGNLSDADIETAKKAILEALDFEGPAQPVAIATIFSNPTFGKEVTWIEVPLASAARLCLKFKNWVMEEPPVEPFIDQFGLPPEFGHSIERSEALALFTNTSNVKNIVCGTAGIGKTQFVLNFIHSKRKEYQETQYKSGYRSVVWFTVSTDERTDKDDLLNAQFNLLGRRLRLVPTGLTQSALIKQIFERLEDKYGPYVVVFDNAPDLRSIQSCLPPSPVPVIITTRNSGELWDQTAKSILLSVFTHNEANQYIKKVLIPHHSGLYQEEEAGTLAKTLGFFPLAITQALDYIIKKKMQIKDFLIEYAQQKITYLQHPVPESDPYLYHKYSLLGQYYSLLSKEHDHMIASIWELIHLMLKKVSINPTAMKVLNVCACLASETPIDIKLLEHWAGNNFYCRAARRDLRRYSLLEIPPGSEHVHIHHLVQVIVREQLSRDDQKAWLCAVAEYMCHHYEKEQVSVKDVTSNKAFLSHIQFLKDSIEASYSNDEKLTQIATMLQLILKSNTKLLAQESSLLDLINQILEGSFPPSSEKLLLIARGLIHNELFSETFSLLNLISEEVSVSLIRLKAHCQLESCDFTAATKTLLLCEDLSKENNSEVKALRSEIEKRQQLATQWQAQVLNYQSQNSPSLHNQIELAMKLRLLNRFDEALDILDKVIVNKPSNDLLATAYFNQAYCYFGLQRYNEARKSIEEYYRFNDGPEVLSLRQKIHLALQISPKLAQLLDHLTSYSRPASTL